MGAVIDPAKLTESGERCLRRLVELQRLGLPGEQLVTAIGTAVEVHVARVLARLVTLSVVLDHRFGSALLARVEKDMNKSWPGRLGWFKSGFDLPIAESLTWGRFETVIEIRSSVVHGDGALSDMQSGGSVQALIKLHRRFFDDLHVEFPGRAKFKDASGDLARQDDARRTCAATW
jgi:hypothetical protein